MLDIIMKCTFWNTSIELLLSHDDSYLNMKPPAGKDFTEEQAQHHIPQHIYHDNIGATSCGQQVSQPNHPVEAVQSSVNEHTVDAVESSSTDNNKVLQWTHIII